MRRAALFVVLAACFVALGCDLVSERRLIGQWRTEATPKRTLDLYADRSYSQRFSGKGLGFLSELVGPEKGTWRVEGGALVLAYRDSQGIEHSRKLPINELHAREVVLAGDRWRRAAAADEADPRD